MAGFRAGVAELGVAAGRVELERIRIPEAGYDRARRTLVCELANDWFGYLPTRASLSEGGCEPSTGSTEYVPGSGERLVEEAVRRLEELFSRGGAL